MKRRVVFTKTYRELQRWEGAVAVWTKQGLELHTDLLIISDAMTFVHVTEREYGCTQ